MNGPEHYRAAEQLLEQSARMGVAIGAQMQLSSHDRPDLANAIGAQSVVVQQAQIHATLALAAATAAGQATAYDGDEHSARSRGWSGVA